MNLDEIADAVGRALDLTVDYVNIPVELWRKTAKMESSAPRRMP